MRRHFEWQGRKVYVLLAALGLGILLLLPGLLSSYALHVLIIAFYYITLAASWNLLVGYMGQFSLAHHAFAAIGGYASGLLIYHFHVPIYIGFVVAIVGNLFLGYLLGILVMKMRAIYLAIATWAFAETIRLLITAGYQITRGDSGLHVPPLFGTLDPRPYFYVFFAVAVISLIIMYAVVHSPIGFFMRAIKDDELAAATMGVNTVRWKLFVFSLSSCLAGIAGFFYAHYVGIVSPVTMEFGEMGKIVIMVMFGGLASFIGPIIGAPVIEFLLEYLRGFGEWRIAVFALLVIVIMRVHPGGAASLIRRMYLTLKSLAANKLRRPPVFRTPG